MKIMKRNPTPTEEAKRQKLAGEVLSVWRDLILAIEDTYAGEQMLSMIPAGWMRTEAEHLQENARLDLYNIINAYDEKRRALREYCIEHDLHQGEWKDGLTMVRDHLRQNIFK